ncbi:hypothetical protein [Senegalimassilia anaerobia]|uniref:hypothetical protein n=1 Tax=Senegalimassilia anaerobia TaxID=1473216 RepID=UPI002671F4FF|nr:hypothetical protein [Senegalimassilia anaerobia]
MDDVQIDAHAFKHGVTSDEILQVWNSIVAMRLRTAPCEETIVAIGLSAKGEAIELVASLKWQGVLVYHAMKPPTEKVLKELGLVRRKR